MKLDVRRRDGAWVEARLGCCNDQERNLGAWKQEHRNLTKSRMVGVGVLFCMPTVH